MQFAADGHDALFHIDDCFHHVAELLQGHLLQGLSHDGLTDDLNVHDNRETIADFVLLVNGQVHQVPSAVPITEAPGGIE